MSTPQRVTTPPVAAWLGYGGLLPFVGLAMAVVLGGTGRWLVGHALLAYGAVILSFVGALHWGFAMTVRGLTENRRVGLFLWSVLPALLAWLALLVPPAAGGALLVSGFLLQYLQDRAVAGRIGLPAWYLPLRLRLTAVACVALLVGVAAADDAHYHTAPASADGIGKFYHGREIAHVMGFEGAPWLDRSDRETEERPAWLIDELKLMPDMTVADIGAGSGFLTRRLAGRVPHGSVYAVDVQPQMVAMLSDLSKQPSFKNILPVLAANDDVRLPADSVDLAIMVDVYHELAFPHEVMQSIMRSLKVGGRLVFVEYRAEDPQVAIKELHKMSERQIRDEMREFPLVWERTSERLPVQHIVIFRKTVNH